MAGRHAVGALLPLVLLVAAAGSLRAQTDEARTEGVQTEELQTEEVQTEELQTEGPGSSSGPPIVRAIELRSDVPLELDRELDNYVAITVGEPLTEEEVRSTLSGLYATGQAARISVSTRPVQDGADIAPDVARDGVVAVIALWSNVIVDEVRIEGDLAGIKRSELEDTIPLEADQPLIETRVLRGDFELEELYARRGYLDTRVNFQVSEPDARNRVTVTYRIDPGAQVTVGPVRFEGDPGPFTREQLVEAIRSRPGEVYRRRAVRQDADRLRSWLIGQDHRTAQVELVDEQRAADVPRMTLTYRVDAGPRLVTQVEGAELKKLRKRDLVPFLNEEGYDEALLLQTVDRIETYYQSQGHYQVAVVTREERIIVEGQPVLRIQISIDPGPEYTLEQVRFEGNASYDASRLEELVETSSSRLLGLGSARLVDEVLNADLRNLRTFYAIEGFIGTRIGPPVIDIEGQEILLTIPIEEGRRRTMGEIWFEGAHHLELDQVRDDLPVREGEGFNDSLLEDALDALRARYDEMGFVRAQVSAVQSWNPDRSVVDLTVQILEGPQQRLGRILVTGNRKTETSVILRELGISAGDPVSGTRLLELERNLARLGLFSDIEVRLTPADLGATRRDVVVRVQEGRTRSVILEAGYDSDDGPRGLVGFSLRNVLGRAYVFRSDIRISTRDERSRISFEQPHLLNIPFGIRYEAFRLEEDRESYDAIRRVGRIELLPRAPRRRFHLAVDFRDVEADDFADLLLVPEEPDDDSGTDRPVKPGILSPLEQNDDGTARGVQIASWIPGFEWERRDDPVEPTRGWATGIQLQHAFPLFEAEASYLKLFAQHSHYASFAPGHVLALAARLGAIEPVETVPGAEGDPLLSIPLDGRFFAGGRTTHRGFSRFALGIDGETRVREGDDREAIGGNGLALLSLEYRFPLFSSVGGTVFVDSGNVWRDWQDIDSRFRNALGVGVRYLSPIGPLRLDLGFKLDRQPGESAFEIHLSFGNPF